MSKGLAFTLVLVLVAACLIAVLPASAGSRTLVVPDDYQTIAAAIGNATAGDTILVKKGTYEGPIDQTLVIDKSISLIGEDANSTVLNLHPASSQWWIFTQPYTSYSNSITVNANNFKLSGFTISTKGGISVSGDRTQITGNNITTGSTTGLSINGSYCNITDNISSGFISLNGSSNVIIRNSFARIWLSGDSNTISNNICGVLRLSNASQNVFSGNRMEGGGIYVGNSSHNFFYGNYISPREGMAVVLSGSRTESNTFYHNNFVTNYSEQVSIYIATAARNFWDNGEEGNFWDGYNGTDSNGDGIGDTPYVVDADNVDRFPLMFPYDVENDTVVLPPPEPFPATLAVAIVLTVVAVGVGVLVYFKKRHH